MNPLYGLIGHPLGHSLSPFIHARLFSLSARNARYELCDLSPERFETEAAARLATLCGGNVTIPYKQRILPLLDRLEGKAALYRTVNTFKVTSQGLIGYNTDADGFLAALRDADIPLQGRVCLLGTGGAATVFACEAALLGCEVTLWRPRNAATAAALCDRVNTLTGRTACVVDDVLPDTVDLLLNATPVGMYPHTEACPAEDALLSRCAAVFDAIYNPRQTRLLARAAAHGAKTAGGMAMLVQQAAIAHELWYDAHFEAAAIAALIDACYDELEATF